MKALANVKTVQFVNGRIHKVMKTVHADINQRGDVGRSMNYEGYEFLRTTIGGGILGAISLHV